jgi:predicted Zn-ribbon and HTH transcriptional regulator
MNAPVYHRPSRTARERVDDDSLSRRELACARCGYSISVVAVPRSCPMCQGIEWRPVARPFGRGSAARLSDREQSR